METINQYDEKLFDYIRTNQDENGWAVLTLNTVGDIIGKSVYFAKNVLDELKKNKQIDFQLKTDHATGRCPLMFRIKEQIIQNESASNKTSIALSKEDLTYIAKVFTENNVVQSNVAQCMKILNVLATLGAKTECVSNAAKKVSDLLVMPNNQVKMYLEMLSDFRLVVQYLEPYNIKLTLSDKAYEEAMAFLSGPFAFLNKNVPDEKVEKTVEALHNVKAPVNNPIMASKENGAYVDHNPAEVSKLVQAPDPVEETMTDTEKNLAYDMLSHNIIDFKEFMSNFQQFFGSTANDLLKGNKAEEVEGLKNEVIQLNTKIMEITKQLEEGNAVLEKLLDQNNNLRGSNASYCEENRSLKSRNNAFKNALDKKNAFMTERLNQAIGEMMTTIVDYTGMPQWKKNPSTDSKFKSEVISCITFAITDIDKFSTNEE